MNDGYGVPEIFEDEARGRIDLLYNDIKFVLKVPIVNFIFRTLALYDEFLYIAWRDVRNNMLTINMETAAESLRYPNISVTPPYINWNDYYDQFTIETIRKVVFTFNYVNTKLLLIACTWAESLANRPIYGNTKVQGYITPGVIEGLPKIKLIDINKATISIKNLLIDIQTKHHAFDIASDYRALAYYPDFLGISWEYLKPYVCTEEYNMISSQLNKRAIKLVRKMPFSVTVNRKVLEEIYCDKDIAGIMGIVSMFQNFLPSLIIDGEFFRQIIV